MRRLLALFVAIAALGLATTAHASPIQFDTIGVYSIDLTFGDENGAIGGGPIGTITGQVSLDEDTGFFVAANFTLVPNTSGPALTFTSAPTFEQIFSTSPFPDAVAPYFISNQSDQAFLILVLPGTSLIGYDGGNVCDEEDDGCNPSNSARGIDGEVTDYDLDFNKAYILGGTLTRTDPLLQPPPISYDPTQGTNPLPNGSDLAATPEPSSFILLGTGLLGFAGIARRRFA